MGLTVVSFILVMSVLVFVHEFGHFLVAKRNKVVVEEFGFGFPPRLVKLGVWDGTIYSINAIPFGGFVRLRGEDNPSLPGSLASASKLARMATLLGGATMNFVLAILIFAILALTEGIQDPAMPGPLVLQAVVPGAPAEQAGLRVGDQIIAADDIPLASMAELQAITKANAGHPVTYRFLRPDSTVGISRTLEAVIVPRTSSLEGRLGVSIQVPIRSATIPEAVWGGIRQTAEIVVVTVQIPAMLIREGRPISEAQLTGPVGIAVLTGQVVRSAIDINSIKPVMGFMAVLSTALGFTNLLPVPGLDGGRLLFVLAEAIRRRRVAPAQEGLVHLIGFGMLLILLGVVTVREVWSLLNGTFPNIGGP